MFDSLQKEVLHLRIEATQLSILLERGANKFQTKQELKEWLLAVNLKALDILSSNETIFNIMDKE